MIWKKGRGTLGPLAPLFGSWEAGADSPMGKVRCTRVFTAVLGGKYIALDCAWHFGKGAYEERALFGADNGVLSFWSFTSDGKRSSGVLSTAPADRATDPADTRQSDCAPTENQCHHDRPHLQSACAAFAWER